MFIFKYKEEVWKRKQIDGDVVVRGKLANTEFVIREIEEMECGNYQNCNPLGTADVRGYRDVVCEKRQVVGLGNV